MTTGRRQSRIAEMMERGATFDEVEANVIDGAPCDSDEKAALWLCAWVQIPVARQEQQARQFAGMVMEGHRTVDDGSAQRLTAVMEVVRDHLEATKRAYGRPRSLDLKLDRRMRQVLGLGRSR